MSKIFLQDATEHPDLFDFRLAATPSEIEALEHQLHVQLPAAYREILEVMGQGIFFDNETLLGVHEADDGTGDIVQVNRELQEKQGLSPTLLVFHLGHGGLHAFDLDSGEPEYQVVALHEDSLERGEVYESIEAWYEESIRFEYASLLGLG